MAASSRFRPCFDEWMTRQELDLDDLLRELPSTTDVPSSSTAAATESDASLRSLVETILRRFEDYSTRRLALSREDPLAFFCPPWCSSFENSFLWMGGCRPAMSIRLVYAQSGSELDAHIEQFLASGGGTHQAAAGSGGMIKLSRVQLDRVDELCRRTLRAEEELSSRAATLQEDVVDGLLLALATESGPHGVENGGGGVGGGRVSGAMEEYERKMGRLLEEADELRLRTARELVMEILMPRQAVQLLAAGKQLHLAVHNWGQNRDRERSGEAA